MLTKEDTQLLRARMSVRLTRYRS